MQVTSIHQLPLLPGLVLAFFQGTNVFFVGMMGTGKSTIARALADVMGRYIFLDTDSIIEELLGASVGEVFATDGEEAFRSVESQVLDQVGQRNKKPRGGVRRGVFFLWNAITCFWPLSADYPSRFWKEKNRGDGGRVLLVRVVVLVFDAGHC